jgi:hypothetical protein
MRQARKARLTLSRNDRRSDKSVTCMAAVAMIHQMRVRIMSLATPFSDCRMTCRLHSISMQGVRFWIHLDFRRDDG